MPTENFPSFFVSHEITTKQKIKILINKGFETRFLGKDSCNISKMLQNKELTLIEAGFGGYYIYMGFDIVGHAEIIVDNVANEQFCPIAPIRGH